MPYNIINEEASSPLIVTAEHAGNLWPKNLPLPDFPEGWADWHIAYDCGTARLATLLAERLNCVALLGKYTRLLVDLNRAEDAADLIATTSDGFALGGNASLTEDERQERIRKYYRPYHKKLAEMLDKRGDQSIMLSLHSFTPRLATDQRLRPWDIGILYHEENSLTDLFFGKLGQQTDLCIGDNEPYDLRKASPGAVSIHARPRGIPYAEIEIRNDGLSSEKEAQIWCDRIGGVIGGGVMEMIVV